MSNEAAERLREGINGANFHPSWREGWLRDLNAALLEERKATVERIRAEFDRYFKLPKHLRDEGGHRLLGQSEVRAILDAEAAR